MNPGPCKEPRGLPGTRPHSCHVIILSDFPRPGDKGEGRGLGDKEEELQKLALG